MQTCSFPNLSQAGSQAGTPTSGDLKMSSNYLHCIFSPEANLNPLCLIMQFGDLLWWVSEKQQHLIFGSYVLHFADYISNIQLFIESVKLL